MNHPKRQALRATGMLAAAGLLAIGLAAGSPGSPAAALMVLAPASWCWYLFRQVGGR